ncbi:hypothetical protein BGZ63DRAFT_401906 [Mariannaea sp. PMI_226]|nr:hypothetical protein BGZ63DRAFT_401906 [Mariannaea sp. PMI_226]
MADSISKRELREQVNAGRRVANMTASQIESKRSIDRANQRYCRAKRKTQMDELRKKVEDLTRELDGTKKQLKRYQDREKTWGGVLIALGLSDDPEHGSSSVTESTSGSVSTASFASGTSGTSPPDQYTGSELTVTSSPKSSPSIAIAFDHNTFGDTSEHSYYQPTSIDFTADVNVNVNIFDPAWELGSSSLGLGDQGLFEQALSPGSPSRPLPWANHFTLDKFDPPFTTSETAEWKIIPPLIAATTQLDQVILGTTETLRQRGFKATKKSQFPSISSLLNPASKQDESEPCSISIAAAEQVARSPVAALLARVGFMYVLSHLMRWYVCRTKESYEQLPEFIRPTLLQRTIPHPPWVDVIVWPDVRDAIIQHMDWSRFLELRAATATSLCVGWLKRNDLRTVFESVDGESYRLTSEFESHLRNSKNWTVGPDAANVFPFLKPVCRTA